MTDEEAQKMWKEHDPWLRASKELIERIQRLNNNPSRKVEKLIEEVGEAPV